MRVCHVSAGLCPRMVKLAWVQQRAGVRTYWIGERHTYQETLPFGHMEIGDDLRFGGITKALQASDADLFHVHTHILDTRILQTVRQTVTKPVLWDCHDEPANGIPEKADFGAVERLGRVVYWTFCPREWFVQRREPKFGLVMATGLSDVPGHWRYWLDAFRRLRVIGWPVVCYTFSSIPRVYGETADMRKAIDVRRLILKMSEGAAGLCGSPHPNENVRTAQPNKLYEYLAAGIPAICLGKAHDMARVIEEHGLGLVVDSVEEIPDALKKIETDKIRERVATVRDRFTMESELPKVMEVYERILERRETCKEKGRAADKENSGYGRENLGPCG